MKSELSRHGYRRNNRRKVTSLPREVFSGDRTVININSIIILTRLILGKNEHPREKKLWSQSFMSDHDEFYLSAHGCDRVQNIMASLILKTDQLSTHRLLISAQSLSTYRFLLFPADSHKYLMNSYFHKLSREVFSSHHLQYSKNIHFRCFKNLFKDIQSLLDPLQTFMID